MGILLVFHQTYQPVLDSILLSALVAGLPLYVLFVLLAILRLPAWFCAVAATLTAFVLSWLLWGMPFGITLGAATEGMAFGLWPISWIVLNAIVFHNLTVASGDFDVIKRALTRLTTDRRLQALLIAFSFGALLEGIAGFGAPVAISASILASLGFEPVTAAVLALLANTAPVAFGSIGIPVVTLGGLVAPILHKDVTSTTLALSAMVGRPAARRRTLSGPSRSSRRVHAGGTGRGGRFAGPHRARFRNVRRARRRDPHRSDGQPALLVGPPGQRPQDGAPHAGERHRRPELRQPGVQALSSAVGRAGPGQGPPGVQVPGLELLLAGDLSDERQGRDRKS